MSLCKARWPVHPHARGEHPWGLSSAVRDDGSSPRPWGTPAPTHIDGGDPRFIPTPVGNTPARVPDTRQAPVHPHARGEHISFHPDRLRGDGSSPRPWGTHADATAAGCVARFIPTPVGNTASAAGSLRQAPVHPHARGEHLPRLVERSVDHGSSPRPWGTHHLPITWCGRRRFIPTPVGNTCGASGLPSNQTVHPHARGEHGARCQRPHRARGSSPRPWGTRCWCDRSHAQRRFIPTPVGNTHPTGCARSMEPVHPHARGEHSSTTRVRTLVDGSSPRPWGTPEGVAQVDAGLRFIPTPVGNTRAPSSTCPMRSVHPHARGEHTNANPLIFKADFALGKSTDGGTSKSRIVKERPGRSSRVARRRSRRAFGGWIPGS